MAACTACHRLSETQTCNVFVHDALVDLTDDFSGDGVAPHDFSQSAFAHAVWMPNDGVARTQAEWERDFGAVRDTLFSCCANPGVDTVGSDGNPECSWVSR